MNCIKPTHYYIGRKPCGCIIYIAAYHFSWRSDTAKLIGEWIRDGLIVESQTWTEYHEMKTWSMDCPHGEIVDGQTMQPMMLLEEDE